MGSELKHYVEQLRNSYNYNVESDCGILGGGINNAPGLFDIRIPPFPFPQHNASQRAIFTLNSFYVVGQDGDGAGDRVGPTWNNDDSGFYVEIRGLGQSGNYVASKSCPLALTTAFCIMNKSGQFNLVDGAGLALTDATYNLSKISGGIYEGKPVLVSNPSGTMLQVLVKSLETDAQIQGTGVSTFNSVINFTIQLIPNEIMNGTAV